jgi:hypothetical protein
LPALDSNSHSSAGAPGVSPRACGQLERKGPSAHAWAAIAVAVVAGLGQWLATSPRWLVHINWDAGSYLHQIASGTLRWSSPTWTAHAALQYLYLAACACAGLFHGTPADGFRLLGAVCFAISAGAMAYAGSKTTGRLSWSVLVVAFWASAFVTQFLTFTLEDNIVFITPSIVLCALIAVVHRRWRLRHGFLAGLLASASLLLSIQGVLYILVPLLFAAFVPRRRRMVAWRVLNLAAVGLGVWCGLALFVGWTVGVSALPWQEAIAHLLERPTSTFPSTREALLAQVFDVGASLRMIGVATALQTLCNRQPFTLEQTLIDLGTVVVSFQIALVLATGLLARRRRQPLPLFFALVLFGLTALTSLYRDVEYAYLKRTDFVPVVLAFLVMVAVGTTRPSSGTRRVMATLIGLVVVAQLVSGLTWRSVEVESYETLDATVLERRIPGYHGLPPEGSYLRHFRNLARANPSACAFVFDLSDVRAGRWNPDVTGTLWSELPNHYVLASARTMRAWPRPLRALDASDPDAVKRMVSGCAWLSAAARKRLGWPAESPSTASTTR